jgi:hypothetical protein
MQIYNEIGLPSDLAYTAEARELPWVSYNRFPEDPIELYRKTIYNLKEH